MQSLEHSPSPEIRVKAVRWPGEGNNPNDSNVITFEEISIVEFINRVNRWGDADTDVFPDPVVIDYAVFRALRDMQGNGVPMDDVAKVIIAAQDTTTQHKTYAQAIKWLNAPIKPDKPSNASQYLEGINGRGFTVKRYRTKMNWSDGSNIVIRESLDGESILRYVKDLIETYKSRGYFVKQPSAKEVQVFSTMKDPSTGLPVDRHMATMLIEVVSRGQRTPPTECKFPEAEEVQRQKQEDAQTQTAQAQA